MIALKSQLWRAATALRQFRNVAMPAWNRYRRAVGLEIRRVTCGSTCPEKNILLLAWEFPPTVGGGVYRPLSFARYGAGLGWGVDVVTGVMPEDVSEAGHYLETLVPPQVEVHRVRGAYKGPVPWLMPTLDGGVMNALAVFEKALEALWSRECGAVLASGPPFHIFVAGAWLARKKGWPLVLDYRDEWNENPFNAILKNDVNRKWERKCLKQADRVLFTTESQLEHMVGAFPELPRDKCHVVFNGWEPQDFRGAERGPEGGRLEGHDLAHSVVFLGNLAPYIQSGGFVDTLQNAAKLFPSLEKDFSVEIIGRQPERVKKRLEGFPSRGLLEIGGQVSKAEACLIMRRAKALLLPNPESLHRYIPGKLYEYIASGTPILLYGKGGEMGEIIESLRAGIIVPEGDPNLLVEACRKIVAGAVDVSDIEERQDWLESRTREYQSRKLFSILEELS